MNRRRLTAACASVVGAVSLAAGLSTPSPAEVAAARSSSSHEQVAWVRRAAGNFVSAELAGDGASACAILNAPLRATEHRRTCAQRWDARLAHLRRQPGARAKLRSQQRAIRSAAVVVHGNVASIDLPAPLLASASNRFLWTENCWMLEG
jgi:hypothetical protein